MYEFIIPFDPLERYLEDFKANIDARAVLEDIAKKQKDGDLLCPRCGRRSMVDNLSANATSRYGTIWICNACGEDEGMRAFVGMSLPPREWAVARFYAKEDES